MMWLFLTSFFKAIFRFERLNLNCLIDAVRTATCYRGFSEKVLLLGGWPIHFVNCGRFRPIKTSLENCKRVKMHQPIRIERNRGNGVKLFTNELSDWSRE